MATLGGALGVGLDTVTLGSLDVAVLVMPFRCSNTSQKWTFWCRWSPQAKAAASEASGEDTSERRRLDSVTFAGNSLEFGTTHTNTSLMRSWNSRPWTG